MQLSFAMYVTLVIQVLYFYKIQRLLLHALTLGNFSCKVTLQENG